MDSASLFVPGRLCLFGEHSDWAAGHRQTDPGVATGVCLLTGTDQGIRAEVSPAEDFQVTSTLPDGSERGPFRVPMDGTALHAAAAAGGFFSYAAGVAAVLRDAYGCGGVTIRARCDLPLGRGLSSSAAVCVLTARALNQVHGLGLDVRGEMEVAYRGERAAGSQCGRMDQACAYGRRLIRLVFDGEAMEVDLLDVAAPLHLLVVDLQASKDTRRILADLHRAFAASAAVRRALGADNQDLVARGSAALERGDAVEVGALMTEAQELFDRVLAPASPELRAPRLHAVLAHPALRELAWGAKGVGSQGDGSAQIVCRGPEERSLLAARLEAEGLGVCLSLTMGAGDAAPRP